MQTTAQVLNDVANTASSAIPRSPLSGPMVWDAESLSPTDGIVPLDDEARRELEQEVTVLREKHDKLEAKLQDLISVARDNDALAEKIHKLCRRLVRARNASAVLDALESSLREDFGASDWLIVLAPSPESGFNSLSGRHLRIVDPAAAELKMFETLFASGKPRCGQIRDSQRDFLFGAGNIEIGSAALVPLGPQITSGLLAIGSPDTDRFHPAMSTEFLARIGELVSEAVGA